MSYPSARKQSRRLAAIGATVICVSALLGLAVSRLYRTGGGEHHCPSGSSPSDCRYPYGPWHWGEGLAIGAGIGLAVFTAWLLVQTLVLPVVRHSRSSAASR